MLILLAACGLDFETERGEFIFHLERGTEDRSAAASIRITEEEHPAEIFLVVVWETAFWCEVFSLPERSE